MPRLPLALTLALAAACSHPAPPAPPPARCTPTASTPEALTQAGSDFIRTARAKSEPALYRNAKACADEALAQQPDYLPAQRLSGLVLLNDHEFTKARDLAVQVLSRHPDDALTWGTRSDAELELGNLPAAIDAAQHMLDVKPNLPSYGRAAHLRWLQGDLPGAKRLYELAIASGAGQHDPEPRAWMVVQAAWLFWHEGDYAGATAGFELARIHLPEYAPALEGLGRTALASRDYPTAVRWLEHARRARPSVETSGQLGDAYALMGDTQRASVLYEEAARDGKRHDPRALATFYTSHDRDPEAALVLAQTEYAQRKDTYTQDALAFALYRNGRIAEAAQHAKKIAATGTLDARLLYHVGLIEIAAARDDAARAAGRARLADALRRNPGFDPILTGAQNAPAFARKN